MKRNEKAGHPVPETLVLLRRAEIRGYCFGHTDRALRRISTVVRASAAVGALCGRFGKSNLERKPYREAMAIRRTYQFILAVLLVVAGPTLAAPIDPQDVRIIDGDTIRVFHKQPKVRLVGFNAPETRRAACEAEGELGAKATRRVRDTAACSQGRASLIIR